MLSRSITVSTAAVLLLACSACSSKYSDVYSFKKNNFKAPPEKVVELPPTPAEGSTPLPAATDGIPGVTPPAPATPPIPGVDPAPPPAPIPGVPPPL